MTKLIYDSSGSTRVLKKALHFADTDIPNVIHLGIEVYFRKPCNDMFHGTVQNIDVMLACGTEFGYESRENYNSERTTKHITCLDCLAWFAKQEEPLC